MILVDTDILIDSMKGETYAIEFIKKNDLEIRISQFTLFELLAGASNKREQDKISKHFKFPFLEINDEILHNSIELFKKQYLKQGTGIIDSIIASTAIYYKIPFFTKNKKHFKNISGLSLINKYMNKN
jgi:tRNA(fMet)-specific endonuclease VapC